MKRNILIITILILAIVLSSGATYMFMSNKYKNDINNNKEPNKNNDSNDEETDLDNNTNNSEDNEEKEYIHVEEYNKKVNDKNVKLTFKFYIQENKFGNEEFKSISYDIFLNNNIVRYSEYIVEPNRYYNESALQTIKDDIIKNISANLKIINQDKEYLLYFDEYLTEIGAGKNLYIINDEGKLLYLDRIQLHGQSINSCENCQGKSYNFNYETGYRPYFIDNGIWYLQTEFCNKLNEYKITINDDKVNKELISETSPLDGAGAC